MDRQDKREEILTGAIASLNMIGVKKPHLEDLVIQSLRAFWALQRNSGHREVENARAKLEELACFLRDDKEIIGLVTAIDISVFEGEPAVAF